MKLVPLGGTRGSRLNAPVFGWTVRPADSNAASPRIGSVPSGPKITRPAVTSLRNSICTIPYANWTRTPSASSYDLAPTGTTPIFESSEAGTIESEAFPSTRNRAA